MKNLVKIFERCGFTVEKGENEYFCQQYTPAGEDWGFYLSNLEEIKEFAENFDPEEEFEMWIEAKHNGIAGVPTLSELWKDQIWKQKKLNSVAKKI